MCTDEEPGPTASLTVALQPPETTGQDYKLSQEDEPPPPTSLTSDLVSLSDTQGGNMMQT